MRLTDDPPNTYFPWPSETLDCWVHVFDDAPPALVLSDAAGTSLAFAAHVAGQAMVT